MTETGKKPLKKLTEFEDFITALFVILADPDKYDTLFRELRDENNRLDILVSAVGPAAEIPGMHAAAQKAHVEAERLLSEAKSVSETLKSEAKAAKVTIITKARAEADANTAENEARLDKQRTETQEGTNKLAGEIANAARAHGVREVAVKGREAKVLAVGEKLQKAQTELGVDEADLQRRLDNLDAAMHKSVKR